MKRRRPSGRAFEIERQIGQTAGSQRREVPAFGKTPEQSVFDPAAKGFAGLQVTQILRGDVDHVIERGG